MGSQKVLAMIDNGRIRAGFGAIAMALSMVIAAPASFGAEMSVESAHLRPGSQGAIKIKGAVANESTFGWSVLIKLVPRDGAVGRLDFTPVTSRVTHRPTVSINQTANGQATISVNQRRPAQVDIRQQDDAWPGVGSFTTYDTRATDARDLNGAVDDNGTLVASPTTFDGVLAEFPVVASSNARGTWDVMLVTPAGSSGWEGIATTLTHGTITIGPREASRPKTDSLRKARGNR